MVEVTVVALRVDAKTKSPVVVLREKGGNRILRIWIGANEANAIAMEMAGVKFERPLTHDLLRQVIVGLGAQLNQVRITTVQDNTYYAELHIRRDDHLVQVDARPSDSIAVALRLHAPIYTAEALLREPDFESVSDGESVQPLAEESDDPERDALKRYLQDLDPEDFGKFTP